MARSARKRLPVETEYGSAEVHARLAWWVPDNVEESMVMADAREEHPDVFQLPTYEAAEMFAVLVERFDGAITFDEQLAEVAGETGYGLVEYDGTITEPVRIPIEVAREQSNPLLAAYLFAHGVRPYTIGKLLDVSENTVEQYVSDVRRGAR